MRRAFAAVGIALFTAAAGCVGHQASRLLPTGTWIDGEFRRLVVEDPVATPLEGVKVVVDLQEPSATRRDTAEFAGGPVCGRDEPVEAWRTAGPAWVWEGAIEDAAVFLRLRFRGAEYQGSVHVVGSSVESIGIRGLVYDAASDRWTGVARVRAYAGPGRPCVADEARTVAFPRRR
jgi:hypothetical protein